MTIIAYLGENVNEYREKAPSLLAAMRICCPKHPSQPMALHGTYIRTIKETGEKISIQILICHNCKVTVAILPDFLLPNKHYSATEIESVILQREADTAVYDIDTPASICSVRRWLCEITEKLTHLVSKLKSLASERYACPISEAILSERPLLEQIRCIAQKLPKIKFSGNLLSYAGIYVQSLDAPNSM